MFKKAREEHPELLEWIEEPEKFLKNQMDS